MPDVKIYTVTTKEGKQITRTTAEVKTPTGTKIVTKDYSGGQLIGTQEVKKYTTPVKTVTGEEIGKVIVSKPQPQIIEEVKPSTQIYDIPVGEEGIHKQQIAEIEQQLGTKVTPTFNEKNQFVLRFTSAIKPQETLKITPYEAIRKQEKVAEAKKIFVEARSIEKLGLGLHTLFSEKGLEYSGRLIASGLGMKQAKTPEDVIAEKITRMGEVSKKRYYAETVGGSLIGSPLGVAGTSMLFGAGLTTVGTKALSTTVPLVGLVKAETTVAGIGLMGAYGVIRGTEIGKAIKGKDYGEAIAKGLQTGLEIGYSFGGAKAETEYIKAMTKPKVEITRSKMATKEMAIGEKSPFEIKAKAISSSKKLIGEGKVYGYVEKVGEQPTGESIFKIRGMREFNIKGEEEAMDIMGWGVSKKLPSPVSTMPEKYISATKISDVKQALEIGFQQDVLRGVEPFTKFKINIEEPSKSLSLAEKRAVIEYEKSILKEFLGGKIPVQKETTFSELSLIGTKEPEILGLGKTSVYQVPKVKAPSELEAMGIGELGSLGKSLGKYTTLGLEKIVAVSPKPMVVIPTVKVREGVITKGTKELSPKVIQALTSEPTITKTRVEQRTMLIPRKTSIEKTMQKIDQRISQVLKEIPVQKQILSPKITTIQVQRQATKTIQEQIAKLEQTPVFDFGLTPTPIPIKTPTLTGGLGLPSGGGLWGGIKRKISRRGTKKEYSPSLSALLFGITAKKVPREVTGFEPIRPIPKGKLKDIGLTL